MAKKAKRTADEEEDKEVLAAIEKKIQIVVREIRKIVDKMGEWFEKKL